MVGEQLPPVVFNHCFLDNISVHKSHKNAFDEVDSSNSVERQRYTFKMLLNLLDSSLIFETKNDARSFFQKLTQVCRDMNGFEYESDDYNPFYKTAEAWQFFGRFIIGFWAEKENFGRKFYSVRK